MGAGNAFLFVCYFKVWSDSFFSYCEELPRILHVATVINLLNNEFCYLLHVECNTFTEWYIYWVFSVWFLSDWGKKNFFRIFLFPCYPKMILILFLNQIRVPYMPCWIEMDLFYWKFNSKSKCLDIFGKDFCLFCGCGTQFWIFGRIFH